MGRDEMIEVMARAMCLEGSPEAAKYCAAVCRNCAADAQAALAALEAQVLVVVPNEPSEAMLEAADMADRGMMPWAAQYRAMIAAAGGEG